MLIRCRKQAFLQGESKALTYHGKRAILWNLFMRSLFHKQNVLRFLLASHKFESSFILFFKSHGLGVDIYAQRRYQ